MREFFELIRADQITFAEFRTMLDKQYEEEYNQIWEDGRDAGYRTAWADAQEKWADEYQRGFDAGHEDGYDEGYQTGYEDGNADGWDRGHDDGLREASQE